MPAELDMLEERFLRVLEELIELEDARPLYNYEDVRRFTWLPRRS